MILRLAAKANLSQEQIAKAVGCSQPTVSRVLSLLDRRKEARAILESGASKLAQTVVETDDAGIALKELGKLDVVREDREGGGEEVGTIVFVGGAPAGERLQAGDRVYLCRLPLGGEFVRVERIVAAPRGGAVGIGHHYELPDDFSLDRVPEGVTVDPDAEALLRRGLRCRSLESPVIDVTPVEGRDSTDAA